MGRKMIAALCAATLVVLVVIPAVGQANSEIERLNREIEALQRAKQEEAAKADAVKRQIKEVASRTMKIQNDIMALDLKMAETQAKIDQLDKQIAQTKVNTKQAAEQLEAANNRVAERDGLLKTRVRMMYESGNVTYLEVLLGSKGFGDFIQRIQLLKMIVDSDMKILEDNKKDRDLIAAKQQEINSSLKKLEGLFAEAETLKQQLKVQLKQKTVVMASLKQQENELEDIKAEYEEAMLKIAAEAAAKIKKRDTLYYTGSGKLIWPLPGYYRLSSPFGFRKDPFTGRQAGHKGLDIPAPAGTDILAAENGIVIVAGYVRGYGYAVIIDHGGGLRTLYAHGLSNGIQVKVGQEVKKGQKIHEVGSTGRSTGNHLHFGVYQDNVPVNPYNLLK